MSVALRLILGVLLLSAAASKLARLRAFSAYLEIPFRDFAPVLAKMTVGAEITLGALSLVSPIQWLWPWLVAVTIVSFTVFYAVRLNLSLDTSCACWGQISTLTEQSLYRRALAPMAVGLRNAIITFAALMLLNQHSLEQAKVFAPWLATALSCEAIVAIGLIASIIRIRNDRGRYWRPTYSTRWQHVRSCRRLPDTPRLPRMPEYSLSMPTVKSVD
jgi:hypothetical protein